METAPDPSEFAIKADKVDDDTKEMLEQKAAGETTVDSEAKFKKISAYIKALRDIPAQKGFPFEVTWPTLEV